MMRLGDGRVFVLLAVIFVWLFSGAGTTFRATAQQPQSKCPTTKVKCPDLVNAGDNLTFTADLRGGDQQVTPTYNWTVSAGAIASGQGMSAITVDTKEVADGASVTATVEIGGFDRECGYGSTVASCTTDVKKKADARKLNE
jgi:hypothetical protein